MTSRREFSDIKFNDRFGYAIAYYDNCRHMKDPALQIIERSKQINLPVRRRPKFHPVSKSLDVVETPQEFIHRKKVEMEIEMLHDKYEKAKESFKRTRELNHSRQKVLYPHYKNTIESPKVEEIFEKVAEVYEKSLNEVEMEQKKENEEEKVEDLKATKKLSVIKDRHSNNQHLIEKRRKDALHDVEMYYNSLYKINERIKGLNKAFNVESEN